MLSNCQNCEKVYNQVGPEKLCGDCRETYIKLFQYLAENSEADLSRIQEDLGLALRDIKPFLRTGRYVAFQKLSREIFKCSRCGGPPDHGNMCLKCFEELLHDLIPADNPENAGPPPGKPQKR